MYLTANFDAPRQLSDIETADLLDPQVREWWKDKVKEIYSLIPDFGGFLVKANSEGEPGLQDYHKSKADGCNMLAEAISPYNGIVMWRCFVYDYNPRDRAREAYDIFKPLMESLHPMRYCRQRTAHSTLNPANLAVHCSGQC